MFKKYDIVFANLNPKKGHTQSGLRPCVIVQNNIFNAKAPTLIVVPITSNTKTPFPSEFIIKSSKENGLKDDSRFLGSQIITIDKEFIVKKIGSLEKSYYIEIRKALEIALDLNDDFL
ncbi:MAG: type II toxin-antitoxin system PemK/MazF family toxin [Candidatus Gracilibacteria bacterium]|nr:type II toxin-antitoxin system PemK/MazF family toxin [Candidatus Gracilibacteria bacterium]